MAQMWVWSFGKEGRGTRRDVRSVVPGKREASKGPERAWLIDAVLEKEKVKCG